jgi:exosortase/archaeosortase family protein
MVEVLFLAILGWRLWFALLGPLLYLYFLVPFGEFLTPKLQDMTAWFSRIGLDLLGIPAYVDGYIIEIPEGTFFVAEACAGLRFLIASIAFGALYSLLMYRSPVRRTLFIGVSIIVPIVANGIRALGIVVLGHVLGSAEAGAADHVLYGWIFFSIVILMLIGLGLPFREDGEPERATASPMTPNAGAARTGMLAGVAVAVLAALGPVLVMGLNRASAMPNPALKPLDLGSSCVAEGPPVTPDGAVGRAIVQRMSCDGAAMTVEIEVFSPRSTAAPINMERRHLTRAVDADDISEAPLTTTSGDPLPGWRIVRGNQPAWLAVAGLWIDGRPTVPGLAMRLSMGRTSVTGEADAPVLIVIKPAANWAQTDLRTRLEMEQRISALLMAHPEIEDQIRVLAKSGRNQ